MFIIRQTAIKGRAQGLCLFTEAPCLQPVLGPVHIAEVVPEQYRYVGSAVNVNALCRQ